MTTIPDEAIIRKSLAEVLTKRRFAAKFTVRQLSCRAAIPERKIRRLESGSEDADLLTLSRLATHLSMALSTLLTQVEEAARMPARISTKWGSLSQQFLNRVTCIADSSGLRHFLGRLDQCEVDRGRTSWRHQKTRHQREKSQELRSKARLQRAEMRRELEKLPFSFLLEQASTQK